MPYDGGNYMVRGGIDPAVYWLAQNHGIICPGARKVLKRDKSGGIAMDAALQQMAMDAAPALVTTSNAGIHAFLTAYIDPKFVEVLSTPNKGAKILNSDGDVKKGDWTLLQAVFPLVEYVGEAQSYGDWNEGGNTETNVNFPVRQSYHFQTFTQWGEREIEIWGRAKLDWAARKQEAAARIIDKAMNNTYFYGVSGLQNYGIINQPGLPAAATPSTKAWGGTAWIDSGQIKATANEIFADIQGMYYAIAKTSAGTVERDAKFVLGLSPTADVALTATNAFGLNVYDLLKKNIPNIRFETAVQYSTAAGELVQLFAEDVEGQETGFAAFTEKMRAHKIEVKTSAFRQKKSAGSWGAVIFNLFAYAQLLGV